MNFSKLGTSNMKVSKLAIGCLHMGAFVDSSMSERIIDYAFDHEINFFDTSPIYGNGQSERIVGKFTKNKRDKVLIASKVGLAVSKKNNQFGVRKMQLNKKNIVKSVDLSLNNIGTDYIDYFQLHCFDDNTHIEDTFDSLNELVKVGKIRSYGCCNYEKQNLLKAISVIKKNNIAPLLGIQCHYNLLERRFEVELEDIIKENNISLLCYQALARGVLSNKYKFNAEKP